MIQAEREQPDAGLACDRDDRLCTSLAPVRKKRLVVVEDDHANWHANRGRFGKRLGQAGALRPGRYWPRGPFPRRER